MNPPDAQFEDLVSRHLDGRLAPDDEARVRERLHRDEAARRRFVELTDLHAMLAGDASLAGKVLAERDRKSAKIIAHPDWHRWWVPAAAAAVLLVLGGVWMMGGFRAAGVRAMVTAGEKLPPSLRVGEAVMLRRFTLAEGSVALRLENGIALELQAPVDATFMSAMRLRVARGRVTADVGEHGKGFVIETEQAQVVDLGTKFGVDVGPAGETDVVVFEGRVDVHAPASGARPGPLLASLAEGEAVRVGPKKPPRRIAFMLAGVREGDWSTRGKPPAGAVITEVRDNLTGLDAQSFYRIAVGGLSAGVSLRRAPAQRWLPAEGERLPGWLEGADVVETFLVDARRADFQMTVTLARPATLYVFYDFHQPAPSWLRERFANTGARLLLERDAIAEPARDAAVMPFTVWKLKVLQAGPVALGPLHEPGQETSGGYMYRLAAKALP